MNKIEIKENTEIEFICAEEHINLLRYKDIQIKSYENLFNSFMTTKSEEDEVNKVNMDNFLEKYSVLFIEQEELMINIVRMILGDNNYIYLYKNFDFEYFFDFTNRTLTLKIKDKKGDETFENKTN